MKPQVKYNVGDLVTCCWEYIPPSPQWNPFIEGRPSIFTAVRPHEKVSKDHPATTYYRLAILTQKGTIITRYLAEVNVKAFEVATEPVKPALPITLEYN